MKYLGMIFSAGVWLVVGILIGCFVMHYAEVSVKPGIAEQRTAAPEIEFYGKGEALITFPAVVRGRFMYCRIWIAPARRVVSTMC
jgi:hypothetical protein